MKGFMVTDMANIKLKIYKLVITISNSNIFFEGIESDLQDCAYIQDVELIESIDNKYKVQIETDDNVDPDRLCLYLGTEWGVNVELIEEFENY